MHRVHRVHRDAPRDNATHFNFDAYTDAFSKIIQCKENKTPFTIAINGTWGSGKTTLMKTLRNKLDNSPSSQNIRKVKTVWFDAWKYAECDSMLAALVCEILEEMERQGSFDKMKSKILKGSEKIVLSKMVSDLANILTQGNGPQIEKWTQKTEYENKLSFYDIFQDYMKMILRTFVLEKENGEYSDTEGVLVIFIDDLDRCPPKNITKVLESINLFLDQEGCFFIIGTDISLISKAIKFEYGDIEGFSGTEYVKKIIQLHFDLPLVKVDDLKDFIKNELKIDDGLEPYLDIITKGLKSNQREIVRFLNSLNLMRALGESLEGGYEEELLIKWSVLNFSSEPFIKIVKNKPELLMEMQEIANLPVKERKEYISNMEDESIKESCDHFKDEDEIIDVLNSGDKKFATENIETYRFLSSVVPKEPPLIKRLDIIHVLDGILVDASGNPIDPKDADLWGADLRNANLMGADLWGADLWGVDLRSANLRSANLKGANLIGADLRGANLIGADLRGANLIDADLRGADLRGADLQSADLQSANLQSANLWRANLQSANLKGANLESANLFEANLESANLRGANLGGANLFYANLIGAKFNKYTLESILLSNKWENAKFDEDVRKELNKMTKK